MMAEAILVHLGLGSNLGDRNEFLSRACKLLRSEAIREFRASSIYESEPLLKMPGNAGVAGKLILIFSATVAV